MFKCFCVYVWIGVLVFEFLYVSLGLQSSKVYGVLECANGSVQKMSCKNQNPKKGKWVLILEMFHQSITKIILTQELVFEEF